MAKLKKCVICGQEFMSTNGRITCSDVCDAERRREMWRKANKRRYSGISGQPITRYCGNCGKIFEAEGSALYCSAACRNEKRKAQIHENNKISYEERKVKKRYN